VVWDQSTHCNKQVCHPTVGKEASTHIESASKIVLRWSLLVTPNTTALTASSFIFKRFRIKPRLRINSIRPKLSQYFSANFARPFAFTQLSGKSALCGSRMSTIYLSATFLITKKNQSIISFIYVYFLWFLKTLLY